jgi:hypothetical protein
VLILAARQLKLLYKSPQSALQEQQELLYLDEIGCWTVQRFYHEALADFSILSLECGKKDTSRTPVTTRATSATKKIVQNNKISILVGKEWIV